MKISGYKIFSCITSFLLAIMFHLPSLAQENLIDINATITDVSGNAVEKVAVVIDEGKQKTFTDDEGKIGIEVPDNAFILLEKDGYESALYAAADLKAGKVVLHEAEFMKGEEDLVNVAFGKQYTYEMIGAVDHIKANEFAKYNNTQNYLQATESSILGVFGGRDIRGMGYTVVVDGMVRDGMMGNNISDELNLMEIEEITVLKDPLSRSLYGTYADRGVIQITTKRGKANTSIINVMTESGVELPVMYPDYMDAADYMYYYNEAWLNDGNPDPFYSQEDIEMTREGVDPVNYPDQQFFTDKFLNRFRPVNKVLAEISGGNDNATYYLHTGWRSTGTLLKMGDENGASNRFNLRGNFDIKVNEFIKAYIDAVGVFNMDNSANYSGGTFWDKANTVRPNDFAHLIPSKRVISSQRDIVESARTVMGNNLLGGSSIYSNNIYGDFLLGGYRHHLERYSEFNLGLEFDLSSVIPGLRLKTYAGYDNYNTFNELQSNTYAVYEPVVQEDDSIMITKVGLDKFSGTQGINQVNFSRRIGWYNLLTYRRKIGSDHDLDVTVLGHMDSYKQSGMLTSSKTANYAGRIHYGFREKYLAEFSASYVGSMRFNKGNRWGISPAAGVSWIISEEEFFGSGAFINFLKLKASYGIVKTDQDPGFDNYYMYQDEYQINGFVRYNDGSGNNRVSLLNTGNKQLTWIERDELNVGMEATLFQHRLMITANIFQSIRSNELARLDDFYPAYLGGETFIPVENYEQHTIKGFEAGLNFNDVRGELSYNIGLNIVNYNSTYDIVNEPDYGDGNEHRQREGKDYDTRWGMIAEGFYTEEEIQMINDPADETLPAPSFGEVFPGDIKYRDINGDGVIDLNDITGIGNWHPAFDYVLSLNLSYRNFDFFTYLRAQTGAYVFDNGPYYWVYGQRKYPAHITNRWAYYTDPQGNLIDTRETATYPRLTTGDSQNNFRASTQWLRSNDFLEIPLIQVGYNFSSIAKKWSMEELGIYLRITNPLTISPENEKRLLNVGGPPKFRSYSVGIKASL